MSRGWCCRTLSKRCFEERVDEEEDVEIRSEPLRLFLHGVPGAGKSKLLEWIRMFFEEVLGWTHGVEFVHVASQHTMTALIGGVTIHSFGNVKFRKKEGSPSLTFGNEKPRI